MAPPRKSTRTEITRSTEWVGSTYTEADINALVFDGVLPDQATAGWRATAGERFLTPDTDELVIF